MSSLDEAKDVVEEVINDVIEEVVPGAKTSIIRMKAAAGIPFLLAAFSVAYFFSIDDILAEQMIAQSAASVDNGQSSLDALEFSIIGPKLELNNFKVWQNTDKGHHEVVSIGHAKLDIEFLPLLAGRIVVNEATLAQTTLQTPLSTEEPEEDKSVPDKTGNEQLTEYLQQAQDLINSEEVKDLREWLEKLKEYRDENSDDDEPAEETEPPESVVDTGTPKQAWYVSQRAKRAGEEPVFVVKKAAIEELNIILGEGEDRFARALTNVNLSIESLSSAPVAYGQPVKFSASGELDGDKTRAIAIGAVVQFGAGELVRLKQIDAGVEIAQVNIGQLSDESVFGRVMQNAKLTVTNYSSTHESLPGRTRVSLTGKVFPVDAQESRAGFSLWFGGIDGQASMVPTGIGFYLQDFPISKLLQLSHGSPIPIQESNALVTVGTCDANGNFDTPEAAVHWADGLELHLRLKIDSLVFQDDGKDIVGLPGGLITRGLNRVVTEMGGIDVIVGFTGKAEDVSLSLVKPGVRSFVDAVINSLDASSQDIKAIVDLPFELNNDAKLVFSSVNPDGSPRDPKLSLTGPARHDMRDLRVAIQFNNINARPKSGQKNIAGLPAADFCKAFNTLVQSENGLNIRTRIMDENDKFSPALESPGLRGLVDAMVALFSYSGAEINQRYDLPVLLDPLAVISLKSVDELGNIRGFSSEGADSNSLAALRILTHGQAITLLPKPGKNTVLGMPAIEFCDMFNRFSGNQKDGLILDWQIFDESEAFSPSLLKPGTRGLVDAMIRGIEYSGDDLNNIFGDVPFAFVPDATARLVSVNADGSVRKLDTPGSESDELNDLFISVLLKKGFVAPRKGVTNIYGIPAQHFTFAWNKLQSAYLMTGMPMIIRLTDSKGNFSPSMANPTEGNLLKQLGQATGILDFKTGFKQLSKNFAKEFPAFEKGGLGAAKKIAEGDFKPEDFIKPSDPKNPIKIPKAPKIPKLPWGK
jgi:ribosomal protein L11